MSGLELVGGVPGAAQIIVFVLVALAIFAVARASGLLSAPRRRRFRPSDRRWRSDRDREPDLTDVGQQLHAVMAGSFQKQRVLSSSEYRVFKIVEDDVAGARGGYRVLAQTSLGEVLQSPDPNAFRSINSKRVDILVIDRGGWPILAVEYQGSGHYQGTAAARDAVKKEALRKAGVRYLEVCADDSDDQIRSHLREQLGWNTAAPTTDTLPALGFNRSRL